MAVQATQDQAFQRPGGEALAPLAALLGARGATRRIATSASRSILESVGTRIEEARDVTRYLTSLLIFLGLLGTFYGLATTVPGVVDTIRALAPKNGEGASEVFERLMTGLESQLGGMGTAFSSSLIGLAGSLVLGLLELFVSHGQNRFYRELEEWISSITRLSFAGAEGSDGETSAVAEILDHMAEQMDQLQAMFTETQMASAQGAARLDALAGALNRLAQETAAEREDRQAQTQALRQIAGGQSRLIEALDALTERTEAAQNDDTDAEIRMRLRSIDGQLPRLLEEIAAGRQESMAEMRGGLAALTRALIGATPTREG